MMEKAVGEKAYQNNEAYERTQMQKDMIIERLREQGLPDYQTAPADPGHYSGRRMLLL